TSCFIVWPSCITCTTSSFIFQGLQPQTLKPRPLTRRYFTKLVAPAAAPIHLTLNPYVGAGSCNPAPALNLEARDVLCLKALRTLLDFELHRLTLVEGLVTVHHDGGEVDENIFPGLALDESIALRSVEPLHCSLFLHFFTSHT